MRTALVTGASKGIGRAIAARLEMDGVRVLTPSRTDMDLNSSDSVERFVSSLNENVDILVNNAGINKISALDDITLSDVAETLQVNLLSAFQVTQILARGMKLRSFGRIVNISSLWSVVTRPGRASYAMSKSALNGMTRTLAVELAPYKVLINAVAPGYVLTDLTRQNNSPHEIKNIANSIPLNRLAEPGEIAEVVAFLCSENNTYLTGQTIIVDGGYSCL